MFRFLTLLLACTSLLTALATPALAQDDTGMEMSDGLSQLTYLSGKAIVQEISPMPDFLDFKVEYVAGRALGEEGQYGGLRFTRNTSVDLMPYASASGSGSIARSELPKAAKAFQQISDELLGSKPSKRTIFNYQTDEGIALVGEFDGNRWNCYLRLTNYDMGLGTPLQVKDIRALADLCQKASKM